MSTSHRHPIPLFAFIAVVILITTGCHSKSAVTEASLDLQVSLNGQNMVPVGHKIRNIPYYRTDTSQPIYEAVLLDEKDDKIGTVLFGESIFWSKKNVFTLTFPLYKSLHRIVLYKLDSSSGHITNKNHEVVLNWIVPPDNPSTDSVNMRRPSAGMP